jgi:hypothetical protein
MTSDGDAAGTPKCVRCSKPIQPQDEAVLTPDGDQYHAWCEQVLASQALIRDAKGKITKSRSSLDRAATRLASTSSAVAIPDDVALRVIQESAPICTACLALHCDTSLEAAHVTIGILRVARTITVSEDECYFCVRRTAVARVRAPQDVA